MPSVTTISHEVYTHQITDLKSVKIYSRSNIGNINETPNVYIKSKHEEEKKREKKV